MKKITAMKIMAILTALAAVFVLAACSGEGENIEPVPVQTDSTQPTTAVQAPKPTDASDYAGEWYDYTSGRACMEIERKEDGSYGVVIRWGSSAWESVEWVMNATYDPVSSSLIYNDGSERIVTYNDDSTDPGIQVLYTDSTGKFLLGSDRITWDDEKDPEASGERLFLRADNVDADGNVIIPDDLRFIGFHTADDQSSLDIYYSGENSFRVDMSITRLAEFEGGKGVYDPMWDTLLVTAEDPNGDPIEFTVSKEENGGMKVEVTNSTWDLLPVGETFSFE